MRELQMSGVQRDPPDSSLGGFLRLVFPVTDYWVTDRGKLRANLILQTRRQRDSNQRGSAQELLHGIMKLSARRSGLSFTAPLLVHSLTPKVMYQRSFPFLQTPAHHTEIFPHGRMLKKLPHQRVPIPLRLRKQQYPGRKPIDAMHGVGALFS